LKYYLNDDIDYYDYLNVQIMVRIRGLSQTLGRVIGRALGREVSGDADEAPQGRRMTTFAPKKREVVPIVEDVEHVDHATNKVHEQHEEAVANDVVVDALGCASEPHDTSILMDYVHHVIVTIWNGEVFIFLNK